jgi:transposase-like protein
MNQLNDPRELKGLTILSKGNMIEEADHNKWMVLSQTGTGYYWVYKINARSWTCTCPDFEKRQMACKHILAVQFSQRIKGYVEADEENERVKIQAEEDLKCPKCGGFTVIKSGVRKTKYGEVQRYECQSCQKRFVVDKGFSKVKFDPNAILVTLDLYFKGVSLRKICDHLQQFHKIKVNPTTPMRWVKKYLKILSRYTEQYKAEVGSIWHSDEMTVFIKKEGEERYYEWIWNVMDAQTRFLLACRVTQSRFIEDAKVPLMEARERADKRPLAVVTDGLQAYDQAITDVFYDRSAPMRDVHFQMGTFQTKPNNNILERLNGTIRERTKVMRSLSGTPGAEDFTQAMQTYYNYIRPHQGIKGKTPAEMAHIPIDFSGNRWQTMIALASAKKRITEPLALI